MRAVIERVSSASVPVDGEVKGEIGRGLLALIGVEKGDTDKDMTYISAKITNLRIFYDESGKMNHSVKDISVGDSDAGVLMVSQFTLLGDARKGRRPSFEGAEKPERAKELFDELCESVRAEGINVEKGVFGADMKVAHVNDGPVTILLDSRKKF